MSAVDLSRDVSCSRECHVTACLLMFSNADCGWLLDSTTQHTVINVTFTFVDTESCAYDFVEIFDGPPSSATSLGKLCGRQLEQLDVYSSGQSFFVKFHSDGSNSGRGFQLSYQAISRSEVPQIFGTACRGEVQTRTVDYNPLTLQYPASSSNYTVNIDCAWLLETTSFDYVVHVNFTFLDTEAGSRCPYDYVELLNGSTSYSSRLGKLCGQTLGDFYSSGQDMYIKFHSDGNNTGRGFRLTYQAVSRRNVPTSDPCRGQEQNLTVDFNAQTLRYPAFGGNYQTNTDCAWLLQTTSYVYVVHVTFTFLDTEAGSSSCSYDYVELLDGSTSYSSRLGKVCGHTLANFYSSGRYMYIKFHSDSGNTGRGFRLTYQAEYRWNVPTSVACSSQGQTLAVNFEAQTLQYPASFSNYPTNTDCAWLLQSTSYDYVVHVTFTFLDTESSISCSYDYIELLDGSTSYSSRLGKVCGQTLADFYSSGQHMYIKFHSDSGNTGRGFQLTYQAVSRWNVPTTSAYANFDFEYHNELNVGAVVGAALGSSLGFITIVTVICIFIRLRQLQQPTKTIATSAGNNQLYTYPYPPTSAPTVAPPSVGAGPPAHNVLFPPSGAGFPVNGVHPMSSPQQQFVPQAVYPAFGYPSGGNTTGVNTQAPGGVSQIPGAGVQEGQVNLSFSMEVAGPVYYNTSDSL